VVAALRTPLPQNADQEPAFLQDIAAFLIANRIPAGVRVTLGVPRGEFFLRRFETPPVKQQSLPELVGFEMERHLPGRREDFFSGWRIDGRAEGGGHVVRLGAVRKAAVERLIALLRRANLAPTSIQPETYALADLLVRLSRDKSAALLIDLGFESVGLDYIRDGRPEFSRIVPIDDPQWRESFAVSTPAADAESEAASPGQAAAERLGAALAERIGAPLFRESLPGGALPELRIAGHGSDRGQVLEKLQGELKVPARVFSPWPQVRWSNAPPDPTPYTSALALAFLGDRGKGAGLELDPERQEALHRAPSLRLSAALASLIVAVLLAHLGSSALRQRRQLELLDEEIERLKAKMTQVEAVNRRVQEQRARLAYLTATVRGRARQAEILRELTVLIPDSAYLSEMTFRDKTVEITGHAPSASQLLPAIEASPLFTGVEFSAPIVAQGAGLERFKIRMRLEEPHG
jgi:general secretion pathway protein L